MANKKTKLFQLISQQIDQPLMIRLRHAVDRL